jgi:energy-coupling factor transport system permease protein
VPALYDLYQPGDSALHRLDARVKLFMALSVTAVVIAYANVWVMLVALVALQMALRASGISRERLAWVWRMTAFPMLSVAVLWMLVYPTPGRALVSFWVVRIGPASIAQGVAVGLRVGVLAWAVFSWLFTTDQATLVRSLVALGLPFEWGLVLAMALRYLPTMALTLRSISEAQQARALDLAAGNPLARARRYAPILVAMIIASLRTADNVSRALEARALGAVPRRTYLRELNFRRTDLVCSVVILVSAAGLLYARLAHGFGAEALRLVSRGQ